MLQLNEMGLADQLAWRTWVRNEGWEAIAHLALAFMGENGEMAEIEKKRLFKPGYKEPKFARLDELGDLWYYTRILGIHANWSASKHIDDVVHKYLSGIAIIRIIEIDWFAFHLEFSTVANAIGQCAIDETYIRTEFIERAVKLIAHGLTALQWTFNELTLLNWWKLCGGRHGWPDTGFEVPQQGEIMELLELDVGNLKRVTDAHLELHRTVPKGWYDYAKV